MKSACSPQLKHRGGGGWAGRRKFALVPMRILPEYGYSRTKLPRVMVCLIPYRYLKISFAYSRANSVMVQRGSDFGVLFRRSGPSLILRRSRCNAISSQLPTVEATKSGQVI